MHLVQPLRVHPSSKVLRCRIWLRGSGVACENRPHARSWRGKYADRMCVNLCGYNEPQKTTGTPIWKVSNSAFTVSSMDLWTCHLWVHHRYPLSDWFRWRQPHPVLDPGFQAEKNFRLNYEVKQIETRLSGHHLVNLVRLAPGSAINPS